jgi:hypothetical protein
MIIAILIGGENDGHIETVADNIKTIEINTSELEINQYKRTDEFINDAVVFKLDETLES